MSVKIHDLFARKAGMSLAAFSEYWTGRHAPVAKRFPQIRHYVQCHRIQEHPLVASFAPTWPDGCAETWYTDVAALQEMVSSPAFPELMEDETRFMNLSKPRPLLASEERLVDNSGFNADVRGVKLLLFACKRAGTDDPKFMTAWARDDDAALGRTLGVSRHIVCTPVQAGGILIQTDLESTSPEQVQARPYDAVRELWWPSREAFDDALVRQAEAWQELLRLPAIDASRSMTLLAQERVIIPH